VEGKCPRCERDLTSEDDVVKRQEMEIDDKGDMRLILVEMCTSCGEEVYSE